MLERPILFGSEMVKAILAGKKTQTRRVVKPQPPEDTFEGDIASLGFFFRGNGEKVGYGFCDEGGRAFKCPYGQPGDELWVRETWNVENSEGCKPRDITPYCHKVVYKADDEDWEPCWRPSIFMPRWASRIQLIVKDVRVERVQDICGKDCLKEGAGEIPLYGKYFEDGSYLVGSFKYLWDSINKKRGYGWDANPWVWVIEFEVKNQCG